MGSKIGIFSLQVFSIVCRSLGGLESLFPQIPVSLQELQMGGTCGVEMSISS